jgi:hypothetical protein
MHELLEKVQQMRLPVGEFAIFGSGPLLLRGVLEYQEIANRPKDLAQLELIKARGLWHSD